MWGAILKLLSGILDFIPKARKWGVDSKAASVADAQHQRIDAAIDRPPAVVPKPESDDSHGKR